VIGRLRSLSSGRRSPQLASGLKLRAFAHRNGKPIMLTDSKAAVIANARA
jgi:hypothetical protein